MAAIIESFPQFPILPGELRNLIWASALPEPRVVEIAWSSISRSLISTTPTPAVLRACRESRRETISNYNGLQFGESSLVVLVDYERDTVYFGRGCKHMVPSGKSCPWVKQNPKIVRDILESTSLNQRLRFVAFDCEFILALDDSPRSRTILDVYRGMLRLQDVTIVNFPEDEVADDGYLGIPLPGVKLIHSAHHIRDDRCGRIYAAYYRYEWATNHRLLYLLVS